MKKNILTVITAALILANFTGCDNSDETPDSKNNISSAESTLQPESSAEDTTTESSTQSAPESVPEPVPVEFTDEDRELQKILADLGQPTSEIYAWMKNIVPPPSKVEFTFPQFDPDHKRTYHQIPYDYRSNGEYSMFAMPNTRSGVEEIMLNYFSKQQTEIFLNNIVLGNMTEDPDGTYSVIFGDEVEELANKLQNKDRFYPRFIELNKRLYWNGAIAVTIIGIKEETAKIISQTDDTIEFSYISAESLYGYETELDYNNESYYSENALKGTLKYERGGWKIDSWE